MRSFKIINKSTLKRFGKRTVSLSLVFMLAFSFLLSNISFNVFAGSATSGSCGPTATWAISEGGKTLTISGYGDMYDFSVDLLNDSSDIPWYDYKSEIETIVFDENSSITSIGANAFLLTNITEVDIPNSVKTIGEAAFSFSRNLEVASFDQESELETISKDAFNGCSNLTQITIPSSVTYIGDTAFANCEKLDYISFSLYESFDNLTLGENIFVPYNPKLLVDTIEMKEAFDAKFAPDYIATIGNMTIEGLSNGAELEYGTILKDLDNRVVGGDATLDPKFMVSSDVDGATIASISEEHDLITGSTLDYVLGDAYLIVYKSNDPTLVSSDDVLAAIKNGEIKEYNNIIVPFSVVPTTINSVQSFDKIVLENGTSVEDVLAKLPLQVEVNTTSEMKAVLDIVWDKESFKYDPSSEKEQTFEVSGYIPADDRFAGSEDVKVTIMVTVLGTEEYYNTGDITNVAPLAVLSVLSLASLGAFITLKKKEN